LATLPYQNHTKIFELEDKKLIDIA